MIALLGVAIILVVLVAIDISKKNSGRQPAFARGQYRPNGGGSRRGNDGLQ
jgi:hypothetical protein